MPAVTSQAAARGTLVSTGSRKAVITAAENNNLATDACKLSHVVVWGDAVTIAVYDDPDSNDNQVWAWATSVGSGVFALQMPMQNGIRVVTGGAGGVTVVWED